MPILKDIEELVAAGVLSQDKADDIQNYYAKKGMHNYSKLFVVFGILGAILVGLGIILIISHNWDNFSRLTKTSIAFLPLVIAQLISLFVFLKKQDSLAWREAAAAFLFFTVGASIAMVSQIYNIPGDLSSFMLTWMLLTLPIAYLMKSSIVSLLYIAGITFYAFKTSNWNTTISNSYIYWLLLLGILPYYYMLYKQKPKSNFTTFHNWLVPLSIVASLHIIADTMKMLTPVAYFSLFGLFYLIGNLAFLKNQKFINNGYKIIGSLGSIIGLLILSFNGFWKELRSEKIPINDVFLSPEFIVTAIITIIAGVLLYKQWKGKPIKEINPIGGLFIIFILIFIIGIRFPIAVVLINILLFVIGLLTIRNGERWNHLGILNYGLLIITALIICRFFDTNLSFVLRGLLFIGVGVGFFAVNYWMLKKRKTYEV